MIRYLSLYFAISSLATTNFLRGGEMYTQSGHGLNLLGIKEEVSMQEIDDITAAALLKRKLQMTYDELKSAGSLSGKPSGTDITREISQYINTSLSFKEARNILRKAGFVITEPDIAGNTNNPNRANDWYAVIANISPYGERAFGRSSLFITLLPKSPGDYSEVEKVTAVIFTKI